jgi:hypothetical protein
MGSGPETCSSTLVVRQYLVITYLAAETDNNSERARSLKAMLSKQLLEAVAICSRHQSNYLP